MDNTLSGTLSTVPSTTQKSTTQKAYNPKRRKAILDLLANGEDPKKVKFIHVMSGGDPDEVDSAISDFASITGQNDGYYGEVNARNAAKAEESAKPNLDTSKLRDMHRSLQDVVNQTKAYRDLYNTKVGDSGVSLTGADSAELRSAQNALMFSIAEAVGTGALQKADADVVRAIIPDPTEWTGALGTTLRGGKEGGMKSLDYALKTYTNKLDTYSKDLGIDTQGGYQGNNNSPLSDFNDEEKQKLFDYAIDNPDNPRSAQALKDLKVSGFFDKKNDSQQSDSQQTEAAQIGKTKESANPVAEGVLSFTGGDKIAKAIGNIAGSAMAKLGDASDIFTKNISNIEEAYQSGKIDEKKRNELLKIQEDGAKSAYGYDGPSFLQVAADAGKLALNFTGAGKVAEGAGALAQAGKLAKFGAAQGALSAIAEGKTAGEVAGETATGALVGGALGLGGKAVSKAYGKISPAVQRIFTHKADAELAKAIENPIEALTASGGKAPTVEEVVQAFTEKPTVDYQKLSDPARKKVKELTKQGFDKSSVQFLATMRQVDRDAAKTMIERAATANEKARVLERPIDVAGKTLTDKLKYVTDDLTKYGQEVDSEAQKLKGAIVDVTDIKKKADEIRSKFSAFEFTPEIKDKVKKVLSVVKGESMDADRLHNLKKAIDEAVTYGTQGEGLKGKGQSMLKAFRKSIDDTLDSQFEGYKVANDKFKAAKDIEDYAKGLFGKDGLDSDKKGAQVLRSIFSNNASRGRAQELASMLDKYEVGTRGTMGGSALDQALFAELLDRTGLFKTGAITGFSGQIEKALNTAANTVTNPKSTLIKFAVKSIDKARNITPEARKKALLDALDGILSPKNTKSTAEKIGEKLPRIGMNTQDISGGRAGYSNMPKEARRTMLSEAIDDTVKKIQAAADRGDKRGLKLLQDQYDKFVRERASL